MKNKGKGKNDVRYSTLRSKYLAQLPCLEEFQKIPFPVRYHLECLLIGSKLSPKTVTKEACAILSESTTPRSFEACTKHLDLITHQRPDWEQLRKDIAFIQVQEGENNDNLSHLDEDCGDYVPIARVLITPNDKILPLIKRFDPTNRMLRQFYKYHDRFLRVEFQNRIHKGPQEAQAFKARKKNVLTDGIVIAGRFYEFLMASDTQMRFGKCWFFAPLYEDVTNDFDHVSSATSEHKVILNAKMIRDWLGDFSSFTSPYKYAARLGMTLSVSRPTLEVPDECVRIIPDFITETREGNEYCFSDGCGQISDIFAEKISKKLQLAYVPSVFQIRYKGVKGVVAVNPSLGHGNNVHLCIRDSMIKFNSTYATLEILHYSAPEYGYLNRQYILILNNLGISADNLLHMQRNSILDIVNIMKEPKSLADLHYLVGDNSIVCKAVSAAVKAGYCKPLTSEPFISRLLAEYSYSKMRKIEKKAVVPLRNGRTAVGVIDETGELQYGEVFFQYSTQEGETIALDTNVVIGKGPALHPGDMRVLRARSDIEGLKHLVDCIVFPRNGPRPHPNELAGSDLDGDTYLICWDPQIVPPMEYNKEPAQYEFYKTSAISAAEGDHEITATQASQHEGDIASKLVDAYANYQNVDRTGAIFNSHMSFADEFGLECDQCLKLVSAFREAVRASKHGSIYEKEIPNPEAFPHYMCTKPTRHSESVLGRMADEAEQLSDMLVAQGEFKPAKVAIDTVIDKFFQDYCKEKEADHINALKDRNRQLLHKYVGEVSEFVSSVDYNGFFDLYDPLTYISKILSNWAKAFHREHTQLGIPDVVLMSFWYVCAYEEAMDISAKLESSQESAANKDSKGHTTTKPSTKNFLSDKMNYILSFPWVVPDVMAKLRSNIVNE